MEEEIVGEGRGSGQEKGVDSREKKRGEDVEGK